jgi:hypothetical protein
MALLDEAVSLARSMAEKIREAMTPPESLAEAKALTQMNNTAMVLDDIAEMLERARCLAADTMVKAGGATLSRFCATWQLVEDGNRLILSRTKPATSLDYEGGKIRFYRHDLKIRMEATPGRIKICRWNMCIEYDPTNKAEITKILPELTYLMRFLMNAARKSKEALIVCARLNKPSCLAI